VRPDASYGDLDPDCRKPSSSAAALSPARRAVRRSPVADSVTGAADDGFGVPLDALPAVADRWVTEDFLNPDYVRIDGKPLLVVYEINDAAQLWGGGGRGQQGH
jgi:hypothetical protein